MARRGGFVQTVDHPLLISFRKVARLSGLKQAHDKVSVGDRTGTTQEIVIAQRPIDDLRSDPSDPQQKKLHFGDRCGRLDQLLPIPRDPACERGDLRGEQWLVQDRYGQAVLAGIAGRARLTPRGPRPGAAARVFTVGLPFAVAHGALAGCSVPSAATFENSASSIASAAERSRAATAARCRSISRSTT